MLTIFTVPKPYRGRVGEIQRNAIESWLALRHDVQVVLVGDEEGVAQTALRAGVEHVGGLARNDRGTPRLDSAFERTAAVAKWPLWCFVNADVVLLDDFVPAVGRVASTFGEFLLIGECRDLDVAAGTPLKDAAARAQLHEVALDRGRLRGYAALDYFVFPRGLFDPVPPFLIGRACFDNWLVWRARDLDRPVVDATPSVVAVHQSHDYSHVGGGLEEAYGGPEARYNEHLAGGREHIYSLHDATHRLYPNGRPVRYWGSTFRARERARGAKAKLDVRIARRRARNGLQRPVRLLGVFPHPRTETTLLLDALGGAEDVELTVLYATRVANSAPTPLPRHDHWFPRGVRLSGIDRALGHDYPVNWAIWKSFYAFRPDCMIIAGRSTFAAQAAVAWCLARRVPYLLLADENDRLDGGEGWRRVLSAAIARRAATVLVPGAAGDGPVIVRAVSGDHRRALPPATDAAAGRVRELARLAWASGRSASNVGATTTWGRLLRHSLRRHARRRRIHSVRAGRRG